jgi:antitoxin component YwqK of YwqJK toxin-antitoxin module
VPSAEVRELRDESGHPIGEAEFLDGRLNGRSRLWTPGGVLIEESNFRNGEHHGSYQTWWDDETPKEAGNYSASRRVGVYRWYAQDGSVLKEHDYGDPK